MTWLVDANLLSEPTKESPQLSVVAWLRENERELAIDPLVLGELRFGILLLADSKRRRRLEDWFDRRVAGLLCLPWDSGTGLLWAELLARLRAAGQAMPIKDSLIAATALRHGLIVATRNRADFAKTGVQLVDPFQGR